MTKQRDDSTLWTHLPPSPAFLPALKLLAPVAMLVIGAGVIFALPQGGTEPPQKPAAVASAPQSQPGAAADDSVCDKQAWPYVDQRCAQQIDAARGTRQVRIVTDKGQSAQTVTPLPIVEAKQPPKPQPVVATADRPIGPPVVVAPAATEEPAPQQTAAAPSKPDPETTGKVEPAPATKALASANMPPQEASRAPVATGSEAFDDTRLKSRSARDRAEKRALDKERKREAKRMRKIEQETGSLPQEVVDAARDEERNADRPRGKKQRARNGGVPDEVIAAVERAAARDRTVTLDSPRGRRVIVVPSEGGW